MPKPKKKRKKNSKRLINCSAVSAFVIGLLLQCFAEVNDRLTDKV